MSSDEGTWYELEPDGHAGSAAERYRGRAEAEQAAMQLLARQPDARFVDIARYAIVEGERSPPSTVSRIAAAQPPAPAEAEVDDLHLLPRGDPEC